MMWAEIRDLNEIIPKDVMANSKIDLTDRNKFQVTEEKNRKYDLPKKWISIQDEHYDRNNFGKKINISRWNNKIIEATILIARKLWRERCEIVNTSNAYTLEQRTRDMAFDICRELRPTAWKLYKEDQHLICKQQSFFRTARFDQIQSWEQAIAKAMKNGKQRIDEEIFNSCL